MLLRENTFNHLKLQTRLDSFLAFSLKKKLKLVDL